MIDPLLQAFTKIINAYLHLDPESRDRLARLQGKLISVELLPLNLTLHYQFTTNGVSIQKQTTQPSDAVIKGTPWQLLNVMVNKTNRQQFFANDLEINGDAQVANEVVKLFDEVHVDLENELARIIGDKAAFHVGNFLRHTKQWLQTTLDAFADDVNDYTHEELQWFPSKAAMQDFFHEIDELAMAVDRFSLKIELFHQQLTSTNTANEGSP